MEPIQIKETLFGKFKAGILSEFEQRFINRHSGDSGIGGNVPQDPIYELNTNEPHELQLFLAQALDECKYAALREFEQGFIAIHNFEFTGQRLDNGGHVQGYYFVTPLTSENFPADSFSSGSQRHCISDKEGVVYEVGATSIRPIIYYKNNQS